MILTLKAIGSGEIEAVFASPEAAFELLLPEADDSEDTSLVDLDKAWHGIHYLLTGTAWEGEPPLNALVVGGVDLPDPNDEWGYGPPRILQPHDVASLGSALAALSDEDLAARFDPADMTAKEIYPEIWNRDPADEDVLGYLMEYVGVLRAFVSAATAKHDGVLLAIV